MAVPNYALPQSALPTGQGQLMPMQARLVNPSIPVPTDTAPLYQMTGTMQRNLQLYQAEQERLLRKKRLDLENMKVQLDVMNSMIGAASDSFSGMRSQHRATKSDGAITGGLNPMYEGHRQVMQRYSEREMAMRESLGKLMEEGLQSGSMTPEQMGEFMNRVNTIKNDFQRQAMEDPAFQKYKITSGRYDALMESIAEAQKKGLSVNMGRLREFQERYDAFSNDPDSDIMLTGTDFAPSQYIFDSKQGLKDMSAILKDVFAPVEEIDTYRTAEGAALATRSTVRTLDEAVPLVMEAMLANPSTRALIENTTGSSNPNNEAVTQMVRNLAAAYARPEGKESILTDPGTVLAKQGTSQPAEEGSPMSHQQVVEQRYSSLIGDGTKSEKQNRRDAVNMILENGGDPRQMGVTQIRRIAQALENGDDVEVIQNEDGTMSIMRTLKDDVLQNQTPIGSFKAVGDGTPYSAINREGRMEAVSELPAPPREAPVFENAPRPADDAPMIQKVGHSIAATESGFQEKYINGPHHPGQYKNDSAVGKYGFSVYWFGNDMKDFIDRRGAEFGLSADELNEDEQQSFLGWAGKGRGLTQENIEAAAALLESEEAQDAFMEEMYAKHYEKDVEELKRKFPTVDEETLTYMRHQAGGKQQVIEFLTQGTYNGGSADVLKNGLRNFQNATGKDVRSQLSQNNSLMISTKDIQDMQEEFGAIGINVKPNVDFRLHPSMVEPFKGLPAELREGLFVSDGFRGEDSTVGNKNSAHRDGMALDFSNRDEYGGAKSRQLADYLLQGKGDYSGTRRELTPEGKAWADKYGMHVLWHDAGYGPHLHIQKSKKYYRMGIDGMAVRTPSGVELGSESADAQNPQGVQANDYKLEAIRAAEMENIGKAMSVLEQNVTAQAEGRLDDVKMPVDVLQSIPSMLKYLPENDESFANYEQAVEEFEKVKKQKTYNRATEEDLEEAREKVNKAASEFDSGAMRSALRSAALDRVGFRSIINHDKINAGDLIQINYIDDLTVTPMRGGSSGRRVGKYLLVTKGEDGTYLLEEGWDKPQLLGGTRSSIEEVGVGYSYDQLVSKLEEYKEGALDWAREEETADRGLIEGDDYNPVDHFMSYLKGRGWTGGEQDAETPADDDDFSDIDVALGK